MTQTPSPKESPAKHDDFDSSHQECLQKLNTLHQTTFQRARHAPTPAEIARRRSLLNIAKWTLPGLASLLLISIAAWPEITHLIHQNSAILREMKQLNFETGHIEKAVYRNIDSQNRPYTLTARAAHQVGENRINLDHPKADILLKGQTWIHLQADKGVYLQHEQTLNLDGNVVLYRSDGLLMNSPTTDIDIKQNIIATHDWVHAEGPFGTEDALGMFLDEKAGIIQFIGPGLTNRFDDTVSKPTLAKPQNKP